MVENIVPEGSTITDSQLRGLVRRDPDSESLARPWARRAPKQTSPRPNQGNHVGLAHTDLACRGGNGHWDIRLRDDADGRKIVFTVDFPAILLTDDLPNDNAAAGPPQTQPRTPTGSDTSGTIEADDEVFPSSMKVCAIDDSMLICKGYERILLPELKAQSSDS